MRRGARSSRRWSGRRRGDGIVDDGSDRGGDANDRDRTPAAANVVVPANRECGLQLGDLRQGLLLCFMFFFCYKKEENRLKQTVK